MAVDEAQKIIDDALKMTERRRTAIAIDQGPTSESQTTGWSWASGSAFLGSPYNWRGVVPISKLYEMRSDPMIGFALQFIKVPLLRAPWYIQCKDAQVAAFVDNALRAIYNSFILQYCNSLDFGYAPIIKRFELDEPDWEYISNEDPTNPETPVWNAGPVKALVWKRFTPIAPENATPKWDQNGNFDGFSYSQSTTGSFPVAPNEPQADIAHALWATNDRDRAFGSLYGVPRIQQAYRYWWSSWRNFDVRDRALEKHFDPAIVVFFPDEAMLGMDTDEPVNPAQAALTLGSLVRNGASIAVPNTRFLDQNGIPSDQREWEIEYRSANPLFSDMNDILDKLDILKLRACLVPEQALLEGEGGTSSRNVAAQMNDTLNQSQYVLKSEIDEHINRFLIPQLVALNFPERKVSCKIVTRGFASVDQELQTQLIQLIGQGDNTKLTMVDLRALLEQGGVPTLTAAETARQNQEAIEAQQAVAGDLLPEGEQPPDDLGTQEPTNVVPPGGQQQPAVDDGVAFGELPIVNGITTQTSSGVRYVEARPVINLGVPTKYRETVKKQYPNFRDSENFDALEDIFDAWFDAFDTAYDQAASSARGLNFSEEVGGVMLGPVEVSDELAKKVAKTAVAAYAKAAKKTTEAYVRILFRTGEKAAITAGYEKAALKEFREAKRWAETRSGELSAMLTATMEQEIKSALSNILAITTDPKEVSDRMREHFGEFPQMKAERLTRGEASLAGNMGVLLAGKALGVKKAKASDASGGTNRNTDEHCLARNGKEFKIEEAIKDSLETHPNCTLQWTLIPPKTQNLSEDQPGWLFRRLRGQ